MNTLALFTITAITGAQAFGFESSANGAILSAFNMPDAIRK